MADTRILRQRLDEQLKQLQEKIRAIDLVEAMSAELGIGGNGSEAGARLDRFATAPSSATKTISNTVKAIALGDPARQWTVATMTPEAQRSGRPDATRTNVTTALRRLGEAGVLEVVSRNKRTGHVYRAAKTAKAAS